MHAKTITDWTPTLYFYERLQTAFDHFNRTLFEGALGQCLMTVRSSNRHHGYHHAQRFIAPGGRLIGELGLHPGYFTIQPVESAMATLVHEMVHVWQHQHGKPSRSNPHNRQWADKMIALGLQPSHTGLPGGREMGHAMSDFIIPSGPFLGSCRQLTAEGFELPWLDRHLPQAPERVQQYHAALADAGVQVEFSACPLESLPEEVDGKPVVFTPKLRSGKRRLRYECSSCSARAWAEQDADILCGSCEGPLICANGNN
jgi:predicted SprT family Zn-dependent metalloprotease